MDLVFFVNTEIIIKNLVYAKSFGGISRPFFIILFLIPIPTPNGDYIFDCNCYIHIGTHTYMYTHIGTLICSATKKRTV